MDGPLNSQIVMVFGKLGVKGTVDIEEDGTYVFLMTGGPTGKQIRYHGMWEKGDGDEVLLLDPKSKPGLLKDCSLSDGKLTVNWSEGIGQVSTMVFERVE